MTITVPKLDAQLEHDIISGIIDAVGRSIIVRYKTARVVCPVCGGNDPFCATCGGNPTTDTVATLTITANIEWRGTDKKIYAPVGQFIEGDCQVDFVVPYNSYETYDMLLKDTLSITVDGRVCVIDKWVFGGSPINRVTVVLNVDDSTAGQRIG